MSDVLVRDLLQRVLELCPAKSRPTYATGFRRIVAEFGDLTLEDITPMDLGHLRDEVRREVGAHTVARAKVRGRALRSYDPDAHGQGAAENLVRSARFFFRVAVNDGHIARSPAADVALPHRRPAPERPLSCAELGDLFAVAAGSGDDPQLDRLLVLFLRHTACRREGCLNLVCGALDTERRCVTISEKNGHIRVLPLAGWLLDELEEFSAVRGAQSDADAVFRYADGHPLTRRRFNTLFDRLDRHTEWSEALDVGPHWLRHTTLSDIAAVSGVRVAEAYAGHQATNAPTILRYTAVDFDDLVTAYEETFGAR